MCVCFANIIFTSGPCRYNANTKVICYIRENCVYFYSKLIACNSSLAIYKENSFYYTVQWDCVCAVLYFLEKEKNAPIHADGIIQIVLYEFTYICVYMMQWKISGVVHIVNIYKAYIRRQKALFMRKNPSLYVYTHTMRIWTFSINKPDAKMKHIIHTLVWKNPRWR